MGLIVHYRLDGDATDAIGNLHGTPYITGWPTGKMGRCGEFDGVNDRIVLGVGSDLFPLAEFSVSLWFKSFGTTPVTGTAPAILGLTYGVRLSVNANRLSFGLDNGSTFSYLNSPADYNFYADNKWHHVAITVTHDRRQLFIDGVLVGTLYDSWKGQTRWMSDTIQLGRDNNNSMYFFRGLLDDVRIYDHALSPREARDLSLGLAVHHTFQHDFYDAVRGERATPVGDVQLADIDGRGCAVINNSGKRLNIVPFSAPVATLTFWYKRDDAQSSSSYRTVLGCVANIHPAIFVQGTRAFGLWDGSFKSSGYVPPNDGSFHFYTTVLQGDGTALFYVDGAYLTTVSTTLTLVNNPIDRIGSWTSYYAGIVGEVKLFATALNASQIKELYQQRASIDSEGNFHVQ